MQDRSWEDVEQHFVSIQDDVITLGSRCTTNERLAFIVMYTTITAMSPYPPVVRLGNATLSPLAEMFLMF